MTNQEREDRILAVLDRVRAGGLPDLEYAVLRRTAVELVGTAAGVPEVADDRERVRAERDSFRSQSEKWNRMWDEERKARDRAVAAAVEETRARCGDVARVQVELAFGDATRAAEIGRQVKGG